MPAWTPHIKIARALNEKLNIEENPFIIGNVMPDILSGFIIDNISTHVNSNITHYRERTGIHLIIISDFINAHKEQFKNPMVLGYLCHLIADAYWNEWVYTKHYKLINNQPFMILSNNKEVKTTNLDFRNLKHQDFKIYDNYLQSQTDMGTTISLTDTDFNYFIDIKEVPCSKEDIDKTLKVLNDIIKAKPSYSPDYKIFTENELNTLLNKTYSHILDILIQNNIIDSNYKIL